MEIKFLQKRKKIIAIENGKVIGHLRLNYPNDHSNRRNINIDGIYIKPEHRRKGIATQMLQSFLNVRIPQVFDLWFELLVEF